MRCAPVAAVDVNSGGLAASETDERDTLLEMCMFCLSQCER